MYWGLAYSNTDIKNFRFVVYTYVSALLADEFLFFIIACNCHWQHGMSLLISALFSILLPITR